MSDFLQRFAAEFAGLDAGNLHRLDQLYSDDVQFRDPLHQIEGLPALTNYFAQLYANVSDLGFHFHDIDTVREGAGYLRWTMHFRHPRLRRGQRIEVDGCSCLRWRDRVYLHQDYFDAGALLYQHLPLMGPAIGWLKGRLA
jgi:hypothetical protein